MVTYELMGTGYVIDHPVEWTASRDVMYDRGRMVSVVTVLTEVAADQDLNAVATGYRVTMDHTQLPVMSPALHEGPVLANLLEWYGEFYDWAAPVATERTELFGTPALLMSAQRDDGSWEFAAMGWTQFPELGLGGYAIHLTAPVGISAARGERIWAALVASHPADGHRPLRVGSADRGRLYSAVARMRSTRSCTRSGTAMGAGSDPLLETGAASR